MERSIRELITQDLKKENKMLFIGGPRQVGKTTLAKQLGEISFSPFLYTSWDVFADQKKILKQKLPPDKKLIIFDEIHKFQNWKNLIKGIYDTHKDNNKIIVTGSSRLDLYQKGGDSLLGRYFYIRLHPFTLAEILKISLPKKFDPANFNFIDSKKSQKVFEQLFQFGGFPESFLRKEERFSLRWRNERRKRIVREDIRDISNIRNLSVLESILPFLQERVASVFSINSLREDFLLNHGTLSSWVDTLENFYYLFRIRPFLSSAIKSIKKEAKVFLWDYSEVENKASRFENLIASHLLKYVNYFEDFYGLNMKLFYLRDKNQREVDFLITKDNKPLIAVEVKLSQEKISSPLKYFKKKLDIPYAFQVLKKEEVDFVKNGIRVMSANKFLSALT